MFRELLGDSKQKKTEVSAPPKATPAAPMIDTVLGTGAHLKGNLKTEGNVRIHGTFVGDITAQGKVAIGENGKLEGDLTSEAVDVGGQVHGNILARKVAVVRTGRIWGDLRLEKLVTEEGAFIQGVVTMEDKIDLPNKPKAPVVSPEKEVSPQKEQAKPMPSAEAKGRPVPKPEAKKEAAASSKEAAG